MSMFDKVWLITGTTGGVGRNWAQAALERGEQVAAVAGHREELAPLVDAYGERQVLALELDVSERRGAREAVRRAYEYFGHLDVVVDEAGPDLLEHEPELTRAAEPVLREQGFGRIVQVVSADTADVADVAPDSDDAHDFQVAA